MVSAFYVNRSSHCRSISEILTVSCWLKITWIWEMEGKWSMEEERCNQPIMWRFLWLKWGQPLPACLRYNEWCSVRRFRLEGAHSFFCTPSSSLLIHLGVCLKYNIEVWGQHGPPPQSWVCCASWVARTQGEEHRVIFKTLQVKDYLGLSQGKACLPFQQLAPLNSISSFPGDGKTVQLLCEQCKGTSLELPMKSHKSSLIPLCGAFIEVP